MGSLKSVSIGELVIGGGAPVRVESMLKTPLGDAGACLAELKALAKSGCELVRVAFPDESLKANLKFLAESSPVPLMADIHFSHELAVAALDAGAPSIRINPGNMTNAAGLASVVAAARANGAVIRVGSNGGSLNARQLETAGGDRAAALAMAVGEQLGVLTDAGFGDVIISAKSSSVLETVRANNILANRYPFPLHIGITEAGYGVAGAAKSAAGIALMLAQGIGDTVRVSLTGDARAEVDAAYAVLRSLGLRNKGVDFISCPCCGRRRVDVGELAERVKSLLPENPPDGLTIAVMGCEVNGPREAANADIGVAGTSAGFVLFRKGERAASGKIDELGEKLREFFAKEL